MNALRIKFFALFFCFTQWSGAWSYEEVISKGEGLPAQGYIDSFHSGLGSWPFDTSDWSEELVKTALVLRSSKVEELLLSRKGYLELLHPNDSYAPYLALPREVKNVFLEGKKKIVQIAHLVEQIERGSKASFNKRIENRKKIFENLTLHVLSLVQMDRLIRFFSEEIFENNRSYDQMVLDRFERDKPSHQWMRSPRRISPYERMNLARLEIKKEIEKKLNIQEILENILAKRAYTLNRYPLLGVKLEDLDCSLYQCIYKDLRRKLNLPDLRMRMSSDYIDFAVAEKIQIHQTFQRQLENNLKIIADNNLSILQFIEPLYDQGIRASLKGNFSFLQSLCQEIYFWDNIDPYLILALDDSHWERLEDGPFWIDREVLTQGKKELLVLLEEYGNKEKFKNQVLGYAAKGFMGLGVVSLLAGWGGPAAMLIFRGAAYWTFSLAGLTYAAKAWVNYVNSKRYAQLAKNLYIGSVRNGYYQIKEDRRIILERDYKDLAFSVASIIFLAGGGPVIETLSHLFRPVAVVAGRGIALTRRNIKFLRDSLASGKNSTLMRFPNFKNIVGKMDRVLGNFLNTAEPFGKGFRNLIKINASKAGMSTKDMIGKISSHPKLKRAVSSVIGDPSLFFQSSFVRRELFVKFLASIYSEVVVRGEDFFKEIDYVALNITFSLFMTFRISANTYQNFLRQGTGNTNIFLNEAGNFSMNFLKKSKDIFIPSLISSVLYSVGNTFLNVRSNQEISYDDALMAVESTALLMITSMIISPLRSRLAGAKLNKGVERLYNRHFKGASLNNIKDWSNDAKVFISIYSRMLVSAPLVYLLKSSGMQSKDGVYANGVVYSYNEPNDNNVKFLFPVILDAQSS